MCPRPARPNPPARQPRCTSAARLPMRRPATRASQCPRGSRGTAELVSLRRGWRSPRVPSCCYPSQSRCSPRLHGTARPPRRPGPTGSSQSWSAACQPALAAALADSCGRCSLAARRCCCCNALARRGRRSGRPARLSSWRASACSGRWRIRPKRVVERVNSAGVTKE